MQLAAVDYSSYLSRFIVALSGRDVGGGGCFSPVMMQKTAPERKIHWVWPDGIPAPDLEEVTDVNKLLPSLQRVLSGEHSTVRHANFRDLNMFVAGEVHNHLEAWKVILEFLRPFWGVFNDVHYVSPATVLLLMSLCLRFEQYYPPCLAKWFSDLFGTGGSSEA